MRKRLTIKHYEREIKLFSRRVLFCAFLVLLFSAVLIFRLVHLQVFQHEFYTGLSEENTMTIVPIEPNRGLIFDRNGVLLAENMTAFGLTINPSKVHNIKETIQKLQAFIDINQEDIDLFERRLKQTSYHQPVPLKLKLDEQETARFYVNQYFFPGVNVETRLIRHYLIPELMGHVLGYVGRINERELEIINKTNYSASNYIGKTGIEKEYEDILHGTVGIQEVETDANGRTLRTLSEKKPVNGQDVYLTIDSHLQQVADDTLGDETGSIIVMKPRTGEILAMVSKPDYNPQPFVLGISHPAYKALLDDPQKPLYDRAIRGLFAPGSTIKPFYAVAGLNAEVITKTFKIRDNGLFSLPGVNHVYHDWNWKKGGHGVVDVTKAIIVSCDVFFYNVATRLGIKRQAHMLREFGFGKPTGIDMPNELGGVVPSDAWKRKTTGAAWYTGDTVVMGIGQGFLLVTPMQLVQAVSILSLRGYLAKPHLLLKTTQDDQLAEESQYAPEQVVELNDPSIWSLVIDAMHQVVSSARGTAHYRFGGANVPYMVAGKTGTSQVVRRSGGEDQDENTPKELRNNALFIAFAPIEDPEIAIVVLYEHNKGADRLARQVMDAYFQSQVSP